MTPRWLRRLLSAPAARLGVLVLACAAWPAQAAVRDADGLTVDRGQAAQRRGAETLHPLRVDRRRFEATGRGDTLELPSTDAGTQRARFVRSERKGSDYTWIGKVQTELGEQAVVITFGEDAVFGTIPQRRGPPLRVESQRGRRFLVEGQNRRLMRAGGKDDSRIPRAGATAGEGDAPPPSATSTTTSTGVPIVDVLVAYTPSMVSRYGSESAVLTRLSYLEALTNQAYADTPASIRIRVVGRKLLNYTTASQNGTLLDLITDPSSNPVKTQIDSWRNQTGADLVTVVRAFDHATQDDCGVGWIGGYHGSSFSAAYGFSVVADGSSSGYYCTDTTFAHELGHNMGSHHDTETSEGDYGAYAYSRGYRQTLSSGSGFATIMAYSDGPQTELNRFSNPALAACMNQACGVTTSADNARSLTNAATRVAAMRASVVAPSLPTLAVADAAVAEGNSGTRTLTFRVSLSASSASTVSFDVATASGSATAGSDFVGIGTTRLSIAPGATTRDVAVTINGDATVEGDETFAFLVSNPSGATLADGSATGTISNDDVTLPQLSMTDATVTEGNSGTKTATFTVKLSAASSAPVTYSIATLAAGSATAGSDYQARSLAGQVIAPGATSATFAVTLNGDLAVEQNENFVVAVSGVTGATVVDGAAVGMIVNDDLPWMRVNDVSVVEGNSGSKLATFTVTLSAPAPATVYFTMATHTSGTATAGVDYLVRNPQRQSIGIGGTMATFAVAVLGDTAKETSEWYAVVISDVTGAALGDGAGLGTIANDD
jgi:hypothetical protein